MENFIVVNDAGYPIMQDADDEAVEFFAVREEAEAAAEEAADANPGTEYRTFQLVSSTIAKPNKAMTRAARGGYSHAG